MALPSASASNSSTRFVDIEPFRFRDLDKLVKNLSDLLGYGIANSEAARFVCAVLLSVKPGAY